MLRSSYVAFFQLPLLPEAWLRAGDHALLRWMLTATSRPGAFDDATLEVYRRAWSQPGALRAMLDWYRGHVHARGGDPLPRVHALAAARGT